MRDFHPEYHREGRDMPQVESDRAGEIGNQGPGMPPVSKPGSGSHDHPARARFPAAGSFPGSITENVLFIELVLV
jgi:hypothetical protein